MRFFFGKPMLSAYNVVQENQALAKAGAAGAALVTGAGAALALAAYIQLEQEDKACKTINDAWRESLRKAQLHDEKTLPLELFLKDEKEVHQFEKSFLIQLRLSSISYDQGEDYKNYRRKLQLAVAEIKHYQTARLDRPRLGGRKGKPADAIDIACNVIIGILVEVQKYDGSNYEYQKSVLEFIRTFLTNFGSLGKDRRTLADKVNTEFLNPAVKHLEQMYQNRSAEKLFNAIGTRCDEAVKSCFELAAALTHCSDKITNFFFNQSPANLEAVVQYGQLRTPGVSGAISLKEKNPFTPQLRALAVQHIKGNLHIGTVAVDSSRDFRDKFLKNYSSLRRSHPISVMRIQQPDPSKGESKAKLVKQNEARIDSRLTQFSCLIRLGNRMSSLSILAYLAANHAKNCGDVAIYTEMGNERLFAVIDEMFKTAKSTCVHCNELFEFISQFERQASLGKSYDEARAVFSRLADDIKSTLNKVSLELATLKTLRNNPKIKEKATEIEFQLDNMLNQMISLYQLNIPDTDRETKQRSSVTGSSSITMASSSLPLSSPEKTEAIPQKERENKSESKDEISGDPFTKVKNEVFSLNPEETIGKGKRPLEFARSAIDDVQYYMNILIEQKENTPRRNDLFLPMTLKVIEKIVRAICKSQEKQDEGELIKAYEEEDKETKRIKNSKLNDILKATIFGVSQGRIKLTTCDKIFCLKYKIQL